MKFSQVWWSFSAELSLLSSWAFQMEKSGWKDIPSWSKRMWLLTYMLTAWTWSPKIAVYKRGRQLLSSPTAWGKWRRFHLHYSNSMNSESDQLLHTSSTVVLLNPSACCHPGEQHRVYWRSWGPALSVSGKRNPLFCSHCWGDFPPQHEKCSPLPGKQHIQLLPIKCIHYCFARTKKNPSISICFPSFSVAFTRPGGLTLCVSDVDLLFCGPCPVTALRPLLSSCRLQQHLLPHGAIPGVGFGGEGQLIWLKACLAVLQIVWSVACPRPLSNHFATSILRPLMSG